MLNKFNHKQRKEVMPDTLKTGVWFVVRPGDDNRTVFYSRHNGSFTTNFILARKFDYGKEAKDFADGLNNLLSGEGSTKKAYAVEMKLKEVA